MGRRELLDVALRFERHQNPLNFGREDLEGLGRLNSKLLNCVAIPFVHQEPEDAAFIACKGLNHLREGSFLVGCFLVAGTDHKFRQSPCSHNLGKYGSAADEVAGIWSAAYP